jgi:hypothetical protein
MCILPSPTAVVPTPASITRARLLPLQTRRQLARAALAGTPITHAAPQES